MAGDGDGDGRVRVTPLQSAPFYSAVEVFVGVCSITDGDDGAVLLALGSDENDTNKTWTTRQATCGTTGNDHADKSPRPRNHHQQDCLTANDNDVVIVAKFVCNVLHSFA